MEYSTPQKPNLGLFRCAVCAAAHVIFRSRVRWRTDTVFRTPNAANFAKEHINGSLWPLWQRLWVLPWLRAVSFTRSTASNARFTCSRRHAATVGAGLSDTAWSRQVGIFAVPTAPNALVW